MKTSLLDVGYLLAMASQARALLALRDGLFKRGERRERLHERKILPQKIKREKKRIVSGRRFISQWAVLSGV